jgi:iron-sulfur cluster assembly protein
MAPLPLISLTDSAGERVKAMLASRDKPAIGIRVGVRSQGCSGYGYSLEFADEVFPFDEVVEDKGVTVLVDPEATLAIFGTRIDWVESATEKKFVFLNPNEKTRCGCGESFSV